MALLRPIVLLRKGACRGPVSFCGQLSCRGRCPLRAVGLSGAGALSGPLACQGQLHGEMQLSVILDFGGDIELTTVNLFNQFGMLLFVEGVHLEQNNAYYSTKSR